MSKAKPGTRQVDPLSVEDEARSEVAATAARLSPTDRLAEMTRERIASLEMDKQLQSVDLLTLRAELIRLQQAEVSSRAEIARLTQAFADVNIIQGVATALIALGGTLVSFTPFLRADQQGVAPFAMGAVVVGIIVFLVGTLMARRAVAATHKSPGAPSP